MDLDKLTDKVIKYSFYGLLVIVPLILTPYNYELFEFNKMLTVYFFSVVIAIAWLIKIILHRQLLIRTTPFDIPLLFFLTTQVISTITSIDRHTSIWGYYSRFHGGLLSTICYIFLYYAYATHLAHKKNQTLINLRVILVTALIVSVYGILEHLGIDKTIWVQDVQNRVFSTLGQPNWLAAYLLVLLPVTIALFLKQKKSIFFYSLIAIYYLTLLFTKSRSGLIGAAVAYLVFWGLLLFKNKFKLFPKKKLLLVSGLLLLITVLVGSEFTPSITSLLKTRTDAPSVINESVAAGQPAIALGGSSSTDIRKVVWEGAIDIWKHYPLFGSGVATFAYSYYNFRPVEHNLLSEWDFLYNKAHNEFLDLLACSGIFGLAGYLLIIIWFTVWVLKQSDPLQLGLLAGFLGLAVSNFFGFSVVPVALFFFLWPAFSLSPKHLKHSQHPVNLYPLNNSQYMLVTITVFLGCLFLIKIINLWQADKIFNLGRNLVKNNQLVQGFPLLQKSVTMSPKEPLFRSEYSEAVAKMAVVYHQQASQFPEELTTEQKIQYSTQASQLRDQMINEAIVNSDIVISQNKVHLNYWKSRAKIFFLLANIDVKYQANALESLQTSIFLAPTDAKLYYNLSLLYVQMGQTGLAEQILLQTIDLKPNYEAARYALANLYEQTDQVEKSREQFQYILDHLNPNNQNAREKIQILEE